MGAIVLVGYRDQGRLVSRSIRSLDHSLVGALEEAKPSYQKCRQQRPLSRDVNMASQQTWANYHSSNTNKGSDEEVQSMIRDVVETIHTLERMYDARAQLLVRALLQDWHALSGMAKARNISYEHP
jgi:hypothetical protein